MTNEMHANDAKHPDCTGKGKMITFLKVAEFFPASQKRTRDRN